MYIYAKLLHIFRFSKFCGVNFLFYNHLPCSLHFDFGNLVGLDAKKYAMHKYSQILHNYS